MRESGTRELETMLAMRARRIPLVRLTLERLMVVRERPFLLRLDRRARIAYRWGCAAPRFTFLSTCARRSDTPTRATARASKEPTGSNHRRAHVRQPRTTLVNAA
jgi:hypothetical protein